MTGRHPNNKPHQINGIHAKIRPFMELRVVKVLSNNSSRIELWDVILPLLCYWYFIIGIFYKHHTCLACVTITKVPLNYFNNS